MNIYSRRRFLENCLLALPALTLACTGSNKEQIPIRAITKGPAFHWFGVPYRNEFDSGDSWILSHEIDFSKRSPQSGDVIRIGMINIKKNDRWYNLGNTQTWNWRQSCMLQWLPGSNTKLVWNNRQGSFFGSVILDTKNGQKTLSPHPVYSLHPDGKTALSLDFERLYELCPGYGYAGLPDANHGNPTPESAGIYRVDLESGARQLLISLAQIARISPTSAEMANAQHYVNHLQFNPDGSRFNFIHGWQTVATGTEGVGAGSGARLVTAATDGSAIRIYNDCSIDAFCAWRDAQHFLSRVTLPDAGNGVILVNDETGEWQEIGKNVIPGNGNCSFLPGREWLVGETLADALGVQQVYLFHVATGQLITLGSFIQPPVYRGEWFAQVVPRFSRDGKKIVIDSAHESSGPQLYLLDISKIVS